MLKENFNKIKSAIGRKNGASAIGQVLGNVAIVFILFLISGAALIFGLNLMGFDLDYTLKTCLGACIVILMIRPFSSKE
jgi:uncharacterized PurR-regulated membrane protein YhhQ (DUF165 family)